MGDMTVEKLAQVVGTPVDRLLKQMEEAGIKLSVANDIVSEENKVQLLNHLRTSQGNKTAAEENAGKITLKRKQLSQLRQVGVGKAKAVNVEIRKKRTFVKKPQVSDSEIKRQELERLESAKKQLEAEEELTQQQVKRNEAPKSELSNEKVESGVTPEADSNTAEDNNDNSSLLKTDLPKTDLPTTTTTTTAPVPVVTKVIKPEEKDKVKKKIVNDDESFDDKGNKKPGAKRTKKVKQEKTSVVEALNELVNETIVDDPAETFRQELHVSSEKRGKRKKKSRRKVETTTNATTKHGFEKPTAPAVLDIRLPLEITVSELAQKMSMKAAHVIKTMMGLGSMVTMNQTIDQATAASVAEEFGHNVTLLCDNELETELLENVTQLAAQSNEQESRAPVVTVMGHVDHGKTSLLDHLRSTTVASGESGGITQHIGAYQVKTDRGIVTFLDTPGHAAFTAMRARGAKITDIVILVVAADDGVMPQTIEAINHAKAAGVPIVVAINKIDKPEANPDHVKQALTTHNVVPEEWGGDAMFVNVSAKTGEGVDNLLESIILQAEVLELKTTPQGPAAGVVIESSLDKGRGPMATILVQRGTLTKGDILLTGHESGRVKAMFDEHGKPINSAGPSTPVVVLGLSAVPNAGDEVVVTNDERKAREIAIFRHGRSRDIRLTNQTVTVDDMFSQLGDSPTSKLNLVIKTDVQGTVEALKEALRNIGSADITINVMSAGVGGISESDANLAIASNAKIIGFNVRADSAARKLIDQKNISVTYYSVIYDVIDDVKKAVNGLLEPEIRESFIGLAEVRDVFKSPKLGAIAGCMVLEGVVKRNNPIRVLRDNIVVYQGQLESLRRFKDDVMSVKSGMECGIGVKNYNDVAAGDQIEVFETIEVARTI